MDEISSAAHEELLAQIDSASIHFRLATEHLEEYEYEGTLEHLAEALARIDQIGWAIRIMIGSKSE